MKNLGSILNNDINNILIAISAEATAPAEYRKAVGHLLDAEPGVLAQNVGMPDPVIYRSRVATMFDKHHTEVCLAAWPDTDPAVAAHQSEVMRRMLEAGTDPLELTIQACRERGVPVVASYRMNAEDMYQGELDLYDFGRQHKHLAIPGCNCLDPVHPEVFEHRMEIFAEVVRDYDIDGIEFDFRRWLHMVSDPKANHPVLTEMVRRTRQLLTEAAAARGRDAYIFGVRVAPTLDGPSLGPTEPSCVDWVPHQQPGMTRRNIREGWGLGAARLQMHLHPLLKDRARLEAYYRSVEILPTP